MVSQEGILLEVIKQNCLKSSDNVQKKVVGFNSIFDFAESFSITTRFSNESFVLVAPNHWSFISSCRFLQFCTVQ